MRLPTYFLRESDGTIRDASGRVIIFGLERFVHDICLGDHCFICGASPKDVPFNNEHIIPRWVLDFAKLFKKSIGLPNQTVFKGYGGYTIPCCVSCNGGLSDAFEGVLAPVIRGGYKAVARHLEHNGPTQFFRWLALLYLKTHLRDARMLNNRDTRSGDTSNIGDIYDWDVLHHVHCIARSHYTGIEFDTRDIGTMLVVPAITGPNEPIFDYADLYLGRAVMIRIGEVAFFAVLNDASIVHKSFPRAQHVIIEGKALNPFQLRELFAGLAWKNLCLETRPSFSTVVVPKPHFEIEMPKHWRFDGPPADHSDPPSYGGLLHALCSEYLDLVEPRKREDTRSAMLKGELSFFSTALPWWPNDDVEERTRPNRRSRKTDAEHGEARRPAEKTSPRHNDERRPVKRTERLRKGGENRTQRGRAKFEATQRKRIRERGGTPSAVSRRRTR